MRKTWIALVVLFLVAKRAGIIGLFPRDRSNNCYLCQAVRIKEFGLTLSNSTFFLKLGYAWVL